MGLKYEANPKKNTWKKIVNVFLKLIFFNFIKKYIDIVKKVSPKILSSIQIDPDLKYGDKNNKIGIIGTKSFLLILYTRHKDL